MVMKLNIKAKVNPYFDVIDRDSLVDPITIRSGYDINYEITKLISMNRDKIVCKINDDYIMMWLGHMLSQSVTLRPRGFMIEHPNISCHWNGYVLEIEIDVLVDMDEYTPFSRYFTNEQFIKSLLIELFDCNNILWEFKYSNQDTDSITHRLISRVDERSVEAHAYIDFGDLFTKGYFEE